MPGPEVIQDIYILYHSGLNIQQTEDYRLWCKTQLV
jgi:hypothetical protein